MSDLYFAVAGLARQIMKNSGFELQKYQKQSIDYFNARYPFTGKKVLEIGGSPPYSVARELRTRGARKICVINNRTDIASKPIDTDIDYSNMDARDLKFPGEEFDIVFGIAVLEHLHDLDKVLAEICRVLTRGGRAYLHGGPLWSCRLGHHVWVQADGVKYEFNANNPIPDWYHLIYNKDEMRRYLETEGIPQVHAQKIADWIYDNPMLNRYPVETIVRILREAKLTIEKLRETSWGNPPRGVLRKLAAIKDMASRPLSGISLPGQSAAIGNYSTGVLEVILRK